MTLCLPLHSQKKCCVGTYLLL
uniref:Uncharacterized protein n=1 Tax=Rhizophora mucronata TaxID=61149 RepID=A0A2P2P8R3_RHIMU